MDTILLKTFLEVAHTRHFGKASQNLCVAPSTISARIRQLEELLGLTLFIRNHQHIHVTPAGERMERHARFLLNAWERAYEDVALSNTFNKRLVIAGVSNLWAIFIQSWLNRVYQHMPNLGLRAKESTSRRVVEKLNSGLIDIGFIYEQPKLQNMVITEINTIPLILVSSQAKQSAQQALEQGYIKVDWGTPFRILHEEHYPQRPLAPIRVNSGRIALDIILNCGGAAYLPEILVAPLIKKTLLYTVTQAPTIKMKAYAAYPIQGEHNTLIQDLLGLM